MQRYFIKEINNFITGDDYHHIRNVMRMSAGDFIIVCDNNACYKAEIVSTAGKIEYRLSEKLKDKETLDITIIQGLPKNNKIDDFLKYATCFGASHIILTEMVRSISKLPNILNKLNRYESIIKEASELSHRNHMPDLKLINGLKQIDFSQFDKVILADEEEKKITISSIDNILKTDKIAVIIGPEGGIDNKEREYLKKIAKSISLGNNILPTEIASLYAITALLEKVNEN